MAVLRNPHHPRRLPGSHCAGALELRFLGSPPHCALSCTVPPTPRSEIDQITMFNTGQQSPSHPGQPSHWMNAALKH